MSSPKQISASPFAEDEGKTSLTNDASNESCGLASTGRHDVLSSKSETVDHTVSFRRCERKKTRSSGSVGKWRPWITVLGAFLVVAVYDGSMSTTGILMPIILNKFEISRTLISVLGPIIYGLPLFLGPVVCCLVTVFGCRPVTLAGAFVLAGSFVLASFLYSSFAIVMLTLGVLRSIGASLMYSPSFIVLPHWFPDNKRLGLAAGIAVCGSGFGGFVMPPLIQYLLTEYGWGWGLTLFGAICFNALVGAMLFKLPAPDEFGPGGSGRAGLDDNDESLADEEDGLLLSREQDLDSVDAAVMAQLSKSDADLEDSCSRWRGGRGGGGLLKRRVSSRDIYAALYKCNLSGSRTELLSACMYDPCKSKPGGQPKQLRRMDGTSSMRSFSLPNVRLGSPLLDREVAAGDNVGCDSGGASSDSCEAVSVGVSSEVVGQKGVEMKKEGSVGVLSRLHDEFCDNIYKLFDRELFTNKRFMLFLFCSTFISLWDSVPDFFLVDFAQTNMALSPTSASFIPSIIGLTSVAGQIIIGLISDHRRINRMLIYAMCLFSGAVVIFCFPLATGAPAMYVLSGVYGFLFFSNYGMQSPILFKLVGIERLAGAFGVVQFFQGTATTVGIPLTGYLVDLTGSFYIPFLCCAFFYAFAASLIVGDVLSSLHCHKKGAAMIGAEKETASDRLREGRSHKEKNSQVARKTTKSAAF